MLSKRLIIVPRPADASAMNLAKEISLMLTCNGYVCSIDPPGEKPHHDADAYITIGGDGTLLGVGRKLAGSHIPILGINFGHVGFLTGMEASDWQNSLLTALSGGYAVNSCMALKWQATYANGALKSGVAVNDVVLARGSLARPISFSIEIDSISMGSWRSDGILISSPLGSSGYNSSAGGPIIDTDIDAICVTAICPLMRGFGPLVTRAGAIVELSPADSTSDCFITIDGQEGFEFPPDSRLSVTGWPDALHLLRMKEHFLNKIAC